MSASLPERPRAFAVAASVALALMFVVVAASAFIRLTLGENSAAPLPVARGVHRAAASLTAVTVLVLALLAWRSRALRARYAASVGAALLLTLALSALGVATGTAPPPAAQFANLFGGLLLLALLAWLGGRIAAQTDALQREFAQLVRLARIGFALAIIQAALGAALATFWSPPEALALTVHVLFGLSTAALAFALGIRLIGAGAPIALGLVGVGFAAPIAGTVSALIDLAPAAALVHPLLGAATLVLLARLDARCSTSQPAA
jgi:Cytochrome oxidase assembly protein